MSFIISNRNIIEDTMPRRGYSRRLRDVVPTLQIAFERLLIFSSITHLLEVKPRHSAQEWIVPMQSREI